MKKMMSVLVVLAIFFGVSSPARSESKVAVVKNGDVFKVIYKCSDPARVKVTISNAEGKKIFSEELISTRGFIRPYNFAEMPKGDYTICVVDVEGEKTEKICLDEETSKSKWLAHISALSTDPAKLMVAVPAQDSNDFSVNVYDRDEQLVYSEGHKSEKEYARVFNLQSLEKGATIRLVNNVTGETKALRTE